MAMSVQQAQEALRQAEFDRSQRAIRIQLAAKAEQEERRRQTAAAMALVEERRRAERQKSLEASLHAQGRVEPVEERDRYTGRLRITWIGSPRGAFGPWMQPPQKSNLAKVHRQLADQRRADTTRRAFAALAAAEGG